MKKLLFSIILLSFISLVFASDFGYDNPNLPHLQKDYTTYSNQNETITGNWTFTGNVTYDNIEVMNISMVDYVQFNTSYSNGSNEGRLQWNTEDGTLEVGMPGSNVNLQIGQEVLLKVKASEDISNCELVYIDGADGNNPTASLAQANTEPVAHKTIGMATEDINSGQNGYVTVYGRVRECNTNAYNAGTMLYLSASTPGAYTSTEPINPNYSVTIGEVLRKSATEGTILVNVHYDIWKTEINNSYVEKAGDTMTGTLNISDKLVFGHGMINYTNESGYLYHNFFSGTDAYERLRIGRNNLVDLIDIRPSIMYFKIGSNWENYMDSSGFIPYSDKSNYLGASNKRWNTVYSINYANKADNGLISLGADDDMNISHDGTNGNIDVGTGVLNINNEVDILGSGGTIVVGGDSYAITDNANYYIDYSGNIYANGIELTGYLQGYSGGDLGISSNIDMNGYTLYDANNVELNLGYGAFIIEQSSGDTNQGAGTFKYWNTDWMGNADGWIEAGYTTNVMTMGTGSTANPSLTIDENQDVIVHNNLTVNGSFKLETEVENDLFFPAYTFKLPGAKAPGESAWTLDFDPDDEEEIYTTFQMPHTRKIDTPLQPHFHWMAADNTTGNVVWCIEYSGANISQNFSAPATKCTTSAAVGSDQTHIISPEINITDQFSDSAMGRLRLYRDATNASDTYAADAKLLQFDVHIYIDKLGEDPII